MTTRVDKQARALLDLDEQAAYLQRESAQLAIRFLEQAEATFERLADMPGMGRLHATEDRRLAGVRVFHITGFERHLVFYRSVEDGIEILRVLHGGRDIPRILQDEGIE